MDCTFYDSSEFPDFKAWQALDFNECVLEDYSECLGPEELRTVQFQIVSKAIKGLVHWLKHC